MPAAVSPNVHPTVEHDDLDDIFNYDAGIDATFNQTQTGQDWNAQNAPNNANANQHQMDVPVNIDEEVKVTKKRKPVAKLDEDRYVGPTLSLIQHSHSAACSLKMAFRSYERLQKTASKLKAKVMRYV